MWPPLSILVASAVLALAGPGNGSAQSPSPETEAAAELGLDRAWTGDFDGMVERRVIRALVPYRKT